METFMGRKVERHSAARVGKKISKLMHEGKPQKKAVAMSLAMERSGRLNNKGQYVRVKKEK